MWKLAALQNFSDNLRYGLRMLLKNPDFAAAVLLTLEEEHDQFDVGVPCSGGHWC
jgi:hypothetical protein